MLFLRIQKLLKINFKPFRFILFFIEFKERGTTLLERKKVIN